MLKQILITTLLLNLAACSSNVKEEIQSSKPSHKHHAKSEEIKLKAKLYFDYDSSSLSAQGRSILKNNAKWLKANNNAKLTIEGHCDERGSREYNIALGERRAYAVKNYLNSLGINNSRLKAISYGEEKPASSGSSESSFRKNRRAEFKLR